MRLLLKQATPYHTSLCMLSGERFENKVRLDWPPPFLENNSYVQILGSSSVNGIFCLFQGCAYIITTVLWNPAAKQFKLVPPSHQPAECNTRPEAFGYDPVREDYKVLKVAEYPLWFEGNWVWLPDANNHYWKMNELLDDMLDNDHQFWDGGHLTCMTLSGRYIAIKVILGKKLKALIKL
ncbi:unnamed protein product [Trifolium pratense]|uniref:Uncharacterized protein n=1 Tax=Trifolium pratense TaxID=57577 RepID=A0ACB0KK79_TRIPR|nr:unnamed protein product [Trifolium pratense]